MLANGFTINSNGRIEARHTLNNLQQTTAAAQLFINCLGLLATPQDGLAAVNGSLNAWGTLTLVTEFGTVGGGTGVPPNPTGITLPTGQTVATGLTLPGGVPLRLRHVSTSSQLTYNPLTYDTAAPSLTQQGLLPWLNVFGVTPLGNGVSLGYNDQLQDPRFGSDEAGATRYRIRVTSSGNEVMLNTGTGAITSLGGFNHDMNAPFLTSALGGGTWQTRNIRYVMSTQMAYGNLSGTQFAVGSSPAQAVASQPDAPLWSYSSLSGPTTLPLAALASATSTTALPGILQSAGFTVVSTTASEIVFTGTYQFGGMNMTESMKEYACLALACTQVARRALLTPDTNHLGDFRATVRFSLPLTP